MIFLALVAVANVVLSAWLAFENRKLTYVAIAKHTGEIALLERSQKQKKKMPTETTGETTYHTWRNADEGVGP